MPAEERVTISLSRPQALVLFELLSRFDDTGTFNIKDKAEEIVLWKVLAPLEKSLTEPFQPDYARRIDEARDQVREQG